MTVGLKKLKQAEAIIRKVILIGSLGAILISPHAHAQTTSDNPTIKFESIKGNKVETMKKEDYTTTIVISKPPHVVFEAVNNVRGWWQGEVKGSTDKLHDEFTYRMQDIHYSKQRIVEVIPDKKVVWLVTESNLSFAKDKSEWTGTKIIFEISELNNQTQLRFTHVGLVPKFECYGNCSHAWEQLIQESLFSLITTGKGKDVFSK